MTAPPAPPDTLKTKCLLTLGLLLMLIPAGLGTLYLDLKTIGVALLCAGGALFSHVQLTAFLKPPRWCRWCFLPAILATPVFVTLGLPSPVSILIPLFALAWVFDTAPWPKPPLWGRGILLSFLGWALLSLEHISPDFGFPRLPSSTLIWVVISLVIPLAIATQPRLRGVARAVLLTEFILVFLALSLTPVVLQIASGFKEIGEPERNFFSLTPLPGFETIADVKKADWIPTDFNRFNDPVVALRVLDHMNQALQLKDIRSVSGEVDPEQAVFLLRQFGFLQIDRYGFYVSREIYGEYQTPKDMDPSFRPVVDALARHASLDLSDSATLHTLTDDRPFPATQKAFRRMMLRLRRLNLVDTIPENSGIFRLTPQARHRLENGLFPRQILFAVEHSGNDVSKRLYHKDYAPEWDLSFEETRTELIKLVDAGALNIDHTLSWYPYRPTDLNIWPVTLSVVFAWTGLLLAGTATPLTRSQKIKLACFALGMVTIHAVSSLPGLEAPLVHQAVWSTLWLPVSALLLSVSIRQ